MLRLKSLFFKPRGRHSLKKQGRPQEESVCKKHSASPGGSGGREGRGSASVTPVGDLLVQLGWLTPPDHPPAAAAAAATVCSHQHLHQQRSATTTAAAAVPQTGRLLQWLGRKLRLLNLPQASFSNRCYFKQSRGIFMAAIRKIPMFSTLNCRWLEVNFQESPKSKGWVVLKRGIFL